MNLKEFLERTKSMLLNLAQSRVEKSLETADNIDPTILEANSIQFGITSIEPLNNLAFIGKVVVNDKSTTLKSVMKQTSKDSIIAAAMQRVSKDNIVATNDKKVIDTIPRGYA